MSQYDARRVIDQLLRQHEAGIKMYLVCRLGGAEGLSEAYAELRRALAEGAGSDLERAPSLPAYAYATARRLSMSRRSDSEAGGLLSVVWQPTPEHESPRYGELLDRIRTDLSPHVSEALELHHARGLATEDLSYVMRVASGDATRAVAEGENFVRDLARRLGSEPSIETLVRDAFRPETTVDHANREPVQASAPRLAQGTLIGGRFEISSAARTLTSQSIYLAGDTCVPGQSVVLHLLHRLAPTTSARTGLLRKLQLLDSVVHASVGRTLAYGWHADRLWYATPWYEGHSLRQLVERGPLSTREAVEIFGPLARGLATLHESGVVHRAISPDKILLLQVGAEEAHETLAVLSGFDVWLVGAMPIADEPRFVAPEVARRISQGADVGTAARGEDVFALGLALLHALEPRSLPPRGEPLGSFLQDRASKPIEIPSSSRLAPFAQLLARVLALDPASRPTAAQFASELEKLGPAVAAKASRRRLWIPIAIGATLVAVLLVAVFVRQSRLKLIRETQQGADIHVLSEELEAERARSQQLEAELEESSGD